MDLATAPHRAVRNRCGGKGRIVRTPRSAFRSKCICTTICPSGHQKNSTAVASLQIKNAGHLFIHRQDPLYSPGVMRENVLNLPEEEHWTKLKSSWSSDRLNRFLISWMYFSGSNSSLIVRSVKILNTDSYPSRTFGCVDRQSRVVKTVRSYNSKILFRRRESALRPD